MKYLNSYGELNEGFITDFRIKIICKKYNITNYTINKDGTIDVNDDVNLYYRELRKLPLKFNKVNGDFRCGRNRFKTLEGSPVEVDFFSCPNNNLKSFKGSPKIIRGGFDCRFNNINSFEFFPRYISRDPWDGFNCDNNPIYWVWILFCDTTKIELLNDFDIFRDEDTDTPAIVMDRLNDFLLTIGKYAVKKVDRYKNI